MSSIKLKNIKQTVIGSTTQPLTIGGILEDGSDAKISIDTSGNLTASNLTATLNGLLTTNGQIKFPATQVPSADANTLDDYEEGTFTPTIIGLTSTGVGTYTIQSGQYVKIGSQVFININLRWTAHTGTGSMAVGSLPFNKSGQYGEYAIASIFTYDVSWTAGRVLTNYLRGAQNIIILETISTGGGTTTALSMDTAGELYATIAYIVA